MAEIWIEKYRPRTFEEVKGQESIVKRVKAMVESGNLPHMLFAGPAGVGKSTLALVVARALFGEEFHRNFLELNASDDRGINVIRETIKDFAKVKGLGVPFKVIFLDEADALTREAQQALRRTMETYSSSTRFVLSCNYSSKILDPILSRCTLFRFQPLKEEHFDELLETIKEREGLEVDDSAKVALFSLSNGDVRKYENILQSCSSVDKKITEDLVYEIVSAAKPKEVKEVISLALKGGFVGARDLLLKTMLKHGLSGTDVIKQIQQEVLDLEIDDRKKVKLVKDCGEIEFRLVEGSDEFVQLCSLLALFSEEC
tara:strand:- start:6338 stop:7282 length:945 start_codon:yes stop_codon:yes gene_type:complete